MSDWSGHLIDMGRYSAKAESYLRAAQSIGPQGKLVALVNAQCALLEAIHAAREALAVVRQMETQQRRESQDARAIGVVAEESGVQA